MRWACPLPNGDKLFESVLKGQVALQAEITSDGFPAYCGLVEAGFSRHHRIGKHADLNKPGFSERGDHINGIESFWS